MNSASDERARHRTVTHLHANNAKKLFRETSVRCQNRSQAEKTKGHPVNPGLCFRDQLRPDFKTCYQLVLTSALLTYRLLDDRNHNNRQAGALYVR